MVLDTLGGLVGSHPNVVDAVIVAALVAGTLAGFAQGMVRQTLAIVGLYVATVLSAQYYRVVSDWLAPLIIGNATARGILSMILIFFVASSALHALTYSIYQRTALTSIEVVDRLGGAALGLLWAAVFVGVMLAVVNFGVGLSWGTEDATRARVEASVVDSQLRAPVESVLPVLFESTKPWLPLGLPAAFTV